MNVLKFAFQVIVIRLSFLCQSNRHNVSSIDLYLMLVIVFLGSGSSSISSGSSTGAQSNAPPIAAVAGAPRNVRDALNMLHQNKQDSSNSVYASNHYSSRTNDNENVNGAGVNASSTKKYSTGGSGPGLEYNNGTSNK